MDEKYLRDYAGRGALLDLKTQSDVLSTADFDENALESRRIRRRPVRIVRRRQRLHASWPNPEMFKAAGVEMPDDTTWTWDDLQGDLPGDHRGVARWHASAASRMATRRPA